MPITFSEIVQDVINEVRAREAILQQLKEALAKIAVLEAQLKQSNVREPDKSAKKE